MGIALYTLADQYSKFTEFGDEHEDTDISDYLSEIKDNIEDKAIAICKLIKNLEAEATAASEESKRLQLRSSSRTNRVHALKEYLKSNLEVAGLDKLRAGLFSLALQASPISAEIVDRNCIASKYVVEQEPEYDKRAMITDHKGGKEVAGVEFKQSTHLRIR